MSPNSHPGQEFDYVLEGSMTVVIDDHEVTLSGRRFALLRFEPEPRDGGPQ